MYFGVDTVTSFATLRGTISSRTAEPRGLGEELTAEFALETERLTDALTYCDATTSPDGERLPVAGRLAEIRSRYGPDHLVTRFITTAGPRITSSVENVQKELAQVGAG